MFRSYAAHDTKSRIKKAEKIIKIISRYKELSNSLVLDIGCGSGFFGSIISGKAKSYIGIDFVDERKIKSFNFMRATAMQLPFKDKSFDIVICNHVIEHVPDQEKLLDEIYRLLRNEGICYITSPNKLWPMEPHLKLPFLSYLPKNIADFYVRASRKGTEYDVVPMTYSKFRKKLSKNFKLENFTLEILKNPREYGFEGVFYSFLSYSRHFPKFMLKMINHLLPNWIIILRKKPIS